ncbi:MAG: CDP-alcohol phosphatidyltransferase family protein [Oscillospiraceae bacterium]|nr:CDP-alcohol phosphatidyltransferase family protein [Oscillospiraceae bacterium]
MEHKKIGYYDYTVVLTYIGMLSAVSGIFMVMNQNYILAVILLMAAGLCDMFDGAVASTKKRSVSEKRFGIQIDSLSDLISFGVLPAVFVYQLSGRKVHCGIISALFILAALIRLAFFNVLEEERQSIDPGSKSFFLGVPVTTIAIILPIVYTLFVKCLLKHTFWFTLMLVVTGIGFITPVKIKKPESLGKVIILVIGIAEVAGIAFVMKGGSL